MRRTLSLCALAFLAWVVPGAAAQARPDFSGRWTSDPDPALTTPTAGGRAGAARGDMGSGWGSTITIAQDSNRLTVEYTFFARGDLQPPLRFVYALDGSEARNTVMMGRGVHVQPSRAAWDGQKLMITTVHAFADPASGKPLTTDVKHTLWLESPASLVVEATRSGVLAGPSSSTRTVYRKVS